MKVSIKALADVVPGERLLPGSERADFSHVLTWWKGKGTLWASFTGALTPGLCFHDLSPPKDPTS